MMVHNNKSDAEKLPAMMNVTTPWIPKGIAKYITPWSKANRYILLMMERSLNIHRKSIFDLSIGLSERKDSNYILCDSITIFAF